MTDLQFARSSDRPLSLWLPVVAYMVAIFIASSMPNPPVPANVPDIDLHAAAYFGLMLVTVRAVARGTWQHVTYNVLAIAFAITVAYGATDEWHQIFVVNRHGELRDLGADAIGALIAAACIKAWSIIRRL